VSLGTQFQNAQLTRGVSKLVAGRRRDASAVRRNSGQDESGAVLILALVFLVAVSLLMTSLLNWVRNDNTDIPAYQNARSAEYAANSVTQLAIQNIRYQPLLGTSPSNTQTLNASPPSYCWGAGPVSEITIDSDTMAAWCSTAWTPGSTATRVVTISTCATTLTPAFQATQTQTQLASLVTQAATSCSAAPYLQTIETFDDYPPGTSQANPGECIQTCGSAMDETSSVWSPIVPSISSISPAQGSIAGGTPVTVTGTGFTGATSATLIDINAFQNIVSPPVTPSNVTSTSLTFITPGVTNQATYFVVVTTPGGTSPGTSVGEFKYVNAPPTITGLGTVKGSTGGGTSLVITGTGFITGATVNFVDTANSSVVVPATPVTVSKPTQIATVTPSVVTGVSTYYVSVTTAGGTFTDTSQPFTYEPIFPVVGGVSPSSGPATGGTPVTITGIGFTAGATVNFVEESGGTAVTPAVSVPATSVSVTNSTTLTAVTPAITIGTTYYVTVTTPDGTSTNYAIFTY